jgi:digeranylgeranylglycerophospholipid reductase
MQKTYDVIVVGAGPAGLIAAKTVGESGKSVLLVDVKKNITKIFRSCCSNLILEEGTHKEAVSYKDGKIYFKENDFSVPYTGKIMPLKNSIKVAPGGTPLIVTGKSPEGYVALSFEKEVLANDIFQQVQAISNIEIMNETLAIKAENTEDGVIVTLRKNGEDVQVKGKIAVAADGVNSKIVQSLGLNKTKRKFFAQFAVVSFHMENVKCPYPDSWVTFVGKGHTRAQMGQLYMCPKPHNGQTEPPVYELTLGMPVMPQKSYVVEEELRNFISEGRFSSWFKDMKIVDTRAATLNFYTPLLDPVDGRVVVVGDAAAFIETYIQGAIMYGYQAGKAINKFLETGSGLEDYSASWGESFEYNDPEEIKLATQGFGLHVLSDEDLDYLFKLTEGDENKGFVNEFSDPITARKALMRNIDTVRKERPKLAETMDKFGEVSVGEALQAKDDN